MISMALRQWSKKGRFYVVRFVLEATVTAIVRPLSFMARNNKKMNLSNSYRINICWMSIVAFVTANRSE